MRVLFEHLGRPGRKVAVRGDFSQWKTSTPLVEAHSGVYRGELDLKPGIYQYKLVIDRCHWALDASRPWIDRTGEFENNTLVVGGSEPPLFFAPARQCWVSRGGQLTVHAEVEVGYAVPEHLELFDEHGLLVARHSLRTLLTVGNRHLTCSKGLIPVAAAVASFEGYPGTFRLPTPVTETYPQWLERAVLYSIFIDRWHRGSSSPPDARMTRRDAPSTPEVFYGGDLRGVAEGLDWIVELGVDAIILTPVHTADSPHRYDAKDFETVDARLGGEKALAELIEACHSRGLRLILDAAFTHCHWQHEAFRDLLQRQTESHYRDWFLVNHFPVTLSDPSSYQHYPGFPEQPMLDLGAEPVVRHFMGIVRTWMQLGVDGLRFDAVEYGPPSTWIALSACARTLNPEVALLAECILDSPARAADEYGVHCVTDYTRHERLVRALTQGRDAFESYLVNEQLLRYRLGPFRELAALQFVDNHDTDRLVTRTGNEQSLRVALKHVLRCAEPVLFYYGTELALTSRQLTALRDQAWPDRLPMPALPQHSAFASWIRQQLRARRSAKGDGGPKHQAGHLLSNERVIETPALP